jgi:hypothetical protein
MERKRAMARKQAIAIGIAMQTHVLKPCPVHRQLYLDDEVNPASAFALAIELVRDHEPFVAEFDNDAQALTNLLSDTLGATPVCCPECQPPEMLSVFSGGRSFVEGALQRR